MCQRRARVAVCVFSSAGLCNNQLSDVDVGHTQNRMPTCDPEPTRKLDGVLVSVAWGAERSRKMQT